MRSVYTARDTRRGIQGTEVIKSVCTPRLSAPAVRSKNRQDNHEAIRDLLLSDKGGEIEHYSTLILIGDKIPQLPPQKLNLIVKDLENRRDFFLQNGNYDESLQAKEAILKAKDYLLEARKLETQKYAQADISLRKGYTNTDSNIFNHMMESEEQKLELKLEERYKHTLEKHEKERIALEEEWNSPSKLRMFNKASQKLLQLRYQQKRMIEANEFAKAAAVGAEADKLEALEIEDGNRRWNLEYQRACDNLAAKQRDELDTFEKNKDIREKMLKQRIETGALAIENRKRALMYHELIANDKDRLWKLKGRNGSLSPRPMKTSTGVRRPQLSFQ